MDKFLVEKESTKDVEEVAKEKAAELEVVISEEALFSNENEEALLSNKNEVDDMILNGVEPLSKFKVVGNDEIVVVLFVVDQVS